MCSVFLIITVLLVAHTTCSNTPSLPTETKTAIVATSVGFSPKPTGKPSAADLLPRQAYFSTCGYYSGTPVSCAPGYACATNVFNYAGCCPMNNVAGCTVFISCVDYAAYAYYGYNPYMYGFNTGICTNMAAPYCYARIWNYATPYTELGCNTAPGYVVIDANPDVPGTGPANAPTEPVDTGDNRGDNTNYGQTIDGNNNFQIMGGNNTITYTSDGGEGTGGSEGSGGGGGTQGGSASRLGAVDMGALSILLLVMVLCF